MTRAVPLRDIAHARAGDKGDRSNICLFVYDHTHYEAVAAQVTAARVKSEFGALFRGAVTRYDLPALDGFNFVLDATLEGGVNSSLNLDGHGKSFSFLLLGLTVELEC